MPKTMLDRYEEQAVKYAERNNDWWPAAAIIRHQQRALLAACEELRASPVSTDWTRERIAEGILAATAEPEEAPDNRTSLAAQDDKGGVVGGVPDLGRGTEVHPP